MFRTNPRQMILAAMVAYLLTLTGCSFLEAAASIEEEIDLTTPTQLPLSTETPLPPSVTPTELPPTVTPTALPPSTSAQTPLPTLADLDYTIQLTFKGLLNFNQIKRYGIYVVNIGCLDLLDPCIGELERLFETDFFPVIHDWSPDGNFIVIEGFSENGSFDLFLANADGSNLINLTNTPDIDESSPIWHNNRNQILYYTCSFFEGCKIYFYNLDKERSELVWPKGDEVIYDSISLGDFSKDGDIIALVISEEGERKIGILDLVDGNISLVPSNYPINLSPVYSSDGKRLAFTSQTSVLAPVKNTISIFNLNNHQITEIEMNFESINSLSWLPESDWIAVSLGPLSGRDFYLLNITTQTLIKVSDDPGRFGFPSWRKLDN